MTTVFRQRLEMTPGQMKGKHQIMAAAEERIAGAFRIADLLTGDIGQAERTNIQGIESWNLTRSVTRR